MHSRNEYLMAIRERYIKAKSRGEKSKLLDEYCLNTGQSRKYVIRKIQQRTNLKPKTKKRRRERYDGLVKAALAKVWEIFDYPCGQRLKPILEVEVDRLRQLGELAIADDVVCKLKEMSPATIDRKLKHQREVLHLMRARSIPKPGSLLKSKIPIRLTEWDTSKVGYVEMDLVFHCGSSTMGEHVNTLSTTEVATGWWEGEAILGKSQESTFWAFRGIRGRTPFKWLGVDSDNGSEFLSDVLYKYCDREKLEFTRSRPSRKNDNAYIEQKNWTHVRKVLGYLRYDTFDELRIINDLYRNELRLYKNFFQPVMKLISKERIGGRVKRKYDTPETPYRRLIESNQISEERKTELESCYLSLNPAQLRREIEVKLDNLFRAYEGKHRGGKVYPHKKVAPNSVTSFMRQRIPTGLPT